MLCLGVTLDSLPPQCGDVPLDNWDWGKVEGEEAMSGTTWGRYHVVGRYDGTRFTVTDVGPPKEQAPFEEDSIETPCPEPEGGWRATDPKRWSREALEQTGRAVRPAPDFAGLWIDYISEFDPDEDTDPTDIILNVAFTGELERHEAEIRETWGGPLCMVHREHTLDELSRIQNELHEVEREFDLKILWSDASEYEGFVEIGVVVIDEETQAALDERYGEGVVRADPALAPLR